MDRYDGVAVAQRPQKVRDLYQKYAQWRQETPDWNTPSPGRVAPANG